MDAQKVDMYLMAHSKYFEGHNIAMLRDAMINADDSKMIMVQSVSLKDPTMAIILSLIVGNLGIDRFIVGDIGMGIAKLLTCGGLGIWYIVDWFLIMNRAKEVNYNNVITAITY